MYVYVHIQLVAMAMKIIIVHAYFTYFDMAVKVVSLYCLTMTRTTIVITTVDVKAQPIVTQFN